MSSCCWIQYITSYSVGLIYHWTSQKIMSRGADPCHCHDHELAWICCCGLKFSSVVSWLGNYIHLSNSALGLCRLCQHNFGIIGTKASSIILAYCNWQDFQHVMSVSWFQYKRSQSHDHTSPLMSHTCKIEFINIIWNSIFRW